jgi:hypothetical protein
LLIKAAELPFEYEGTLLKPSSIIKLLDGEDIIQGHYLQSKLLVVTNKQEVWSIERTSPRKIDLQFSIRSVACSENMALFLSSSGQVYSWGEDIQNTGILGTGRDNCRTPHIIPGLSNIIQLSIGKGFAAALDSKIQSGTGTLFGWGGCYGTKASPVSHTQSLLLKQIACGDNYIFVSTKGGHPYMIGDFFKQHQRLLSPHEISKFVVKHVYASGEFAAFITETDEAYVFDSSYEAIKLPQRHKIKSLMLKRSSCWGIGYRNLSDVFVYHWRDMQYRSSDITTWSALVFKVNPRYRSPYLSGSILTAEYDMNNEEYEELGTLIGKHNSSLKSPNIKVNGLNQVSSDCDILSPVLMNKKRPFDFEKCEKIHNLVESVKRCLLRKCWDMIYDYRVKIYTVKYFCFQKPHINLFKIDLAPKRFIASKGSLHRSKSLSIDLDQTNPSESSTKSKAPTESSTNSKPVGPQISIPKHLKSPANNIKAPRPAPVAVNTQLKGNKHRTIETQTPDSGTSLSRMNTPKLAKRPTTRSPTYRIRSPPQKVSIKPTKDPGKPFDFDKPLYPIDFRFKHMLGNLSPRYPGLMNNNPQVNKLKSSASLKFLYNTMTGGNMFRNTFDRFTKKPQPDQNPWRSPGSSSLVHSNNINKVQRAKEYSEKLRQRKRSNTDDAKLTFTNFDHKMLLCSMHGSSFENSSHEERHPKFILGASKLVKIFETRGLLAKSYIFKLFNHCYINLINEERDIERKVSLYIKALTKLWHFFHRIHFGQMRWAMTRIVN